MIEPRVEKQKGVIHAITLSCRKWRKEHGYRQEDVGRLVEMKQPSVSCFERGKSDSLSLLGAYVALGYDMKGDEELCRQLAILKT